MFKINNKYTINTLFKINNKLLLTLNIFHNFFSVFIIDIDNNSMYGGMDLSIFFIIFIICDKHDICDKMWYM